MEELDTVFYGGHNFTDYVKGNESDLSKAHRTQKRFWEIISMASFHFICFLTLSWDSHRCGLVKLVWRHLKWSLPSTRMPLWSSLGKMSVVWPIPVLELAFACPAPTTSSVEAVGRSAIIWAAKGWGNTSEFNVEQAAVQVVPWWKPLWRKSSTFFNFWVVPFCFSSVWKHDPSNLTFDSHNATAPVLPQLKMWDVKLSRYHHQSLSQAARPLVQAKPWRNDTRHHFEQMFETFCWKHFGLDLLDFFDLPDLHWVVIWFCWYGFMCHTSWHLRGTWRRLAWDLVGHRHAHQQQLPNG